MARAASATAASSMPIYHVVTAGRGRKPNPYGHPSVAGEQAPASRSHGESLTPAEPSGCHPVRTWHGAAPARPAQLRHDALSAARPTP